ncbi:MAG TPA: SipW-dependent-type signal peptide-containing protein [Negativicutes bacterium]|nr:SipW-dependent-type signal peptide-containing protein [Negativicutes bacterium]
MKKSKLIIIVAIVALLVVGGAYAAWTSRTTVAVNASSGEMDVAISATSVGKVSEYVLFAKNNITVSEDQKAATVSIANLYPGAEANATITITNTGTIPVKLSGCTQERISAVDTKTNKALSATDAGMLIVKYNATAVTKTGQVKASDTSTAATATLFSTANMVIEAGATITFDIQIMLDKNAADSTENALYTFKFTPMFVQAN